MAEMIQACIGAYNGDLGTNDNIDPATADNVPGTDHNVDACTSDDIPSIATIHLYIYQRRSFIQAYNCHSSRHLTGFIQAPSI